MTHLVPCPSCQRHVRAGEGSCPFCAVSLELAAMPPPRLPRSRLGRAATFAFGATIAGLTSLSACSDGEDDDGSGGGAGVTGSGGASGAGGSGTGGSATGGASGSGGSAATGGSVLDDGGAVPLYGAAP
jgi:hypothetical protein